MCAQLLSSASITTIITLVMERLRTVGVRPRTADDGPRCTGCTTFVPLTKIACGTPENHMNKRVQRNTPPVYRVYHRLCVSTQKWTVDRSYRFLFKERYNRYKWYTYHETLLTRGLQVYHLLFLRGTPKRGSVNKSIT